MCEIITTPVAATLCVNYLFRHKIALSATAETCWRAKYTRANAARRVAGISYAACSTSLARSARSADSISRILLLRVTVTAKCRVRINAPDDATPFAWAGRLRLASARVIVVRILHTAARNAHYF